MIKRYSIAEVAIAPLRASFFLLPSGSIVQSQAPDQTKYYDTREHINQEEELFGDRNESSYIQDIAARKQIVLRGGDGAMLAPMMPTRAQFTKLASLERTLNKPLAWSVELEDDYLDGSAVSNLQDTLMAHDYSNPGAIQAIILPIALLVFLKLWHDIYN